MYLRGRHGQARRERDQLQRDSGDQKTGPESLLSELVKQGTEVSLASLTVSPADARGDINVVGHKNAIVISESDL